MGSIKSESGIKHHASREEEEGKPRFSEHAGSKMRGKRKWKS